MGKVDEVVVLVQQLLKKDTRGLTIQEIATRAKVSRVTASLALMKLEGADLIEVRSVGNCKLHYLKGL